MLSGHATSHQVGEVPPVLTTIIGRGHSGTRAMSHTLSASGVWMGEPLNVSGDLLPPQAMYEASRLIARHVRWLGGLEWDFSRLHTMPIPPEFVALTRSYLHSVLTSCARSTTSRVEPAASMPSDTARVRTSSFSSLASTQGDQPLTSAGSGCSAATNSEILAAISWAGTSRSTAASGRVRTRRPRPCAPPEQTARGRRRHARRRSAIRCRRAPVRTGTVRRSQLADTGPCR